MRFSGKRCWLAAMLMAQASWAQVYDRGLAYHQNAAVLGGSVEANDLFGMSLGVGDYNGDGRDELVIGQVSEGSDQNGGQAYVLYDWRQGPSGDYGFGGAQRWRQGATSAGDSPNAGNWFGVAVATGDFNDDGFDDLAIGAHTDFVGAVASAGVVHVLYGASLGLTITGRQVWNQATASPDNQVAEEGDYFGGSLAAGDFNGDGFDDLAVGAFGEDLGSAENAGMVSVLYGSSIGLLGTGTQLWRQGSGGVADAAEPFDTFGGELATGDFNGDGFDDLAVGVEGESFGSADRAGGVHVILGSPSGLTHIGDGLWDQDTLGEVSEDDDSCGHSLATADFNGDGRDDLAFGCPGEDFENSSLTNVGKLWVLKGSPTGLTSDGAQVWFESFSGGDGHSSGDGYGAVLTAADLDGNGTPDLAVGMPSEDLELPGETRLDTGQVLVLYSSPGIGLDVTRPRQRFVEVPGFLGGQVLAGDFFGSALTAGDFDGDGVAALVCSSPWEDLFGFDWAGIVRVYEDGLLFANGFESGGLVGWVVGGSCPSC